MTTKKRFAPTMPAPPPAVRTVQQARQPPATRAQNAAATKAGMDAGAPKASRPPSKRARSKS